MKISSLVTSTKRKQKIFYLSLSPDVILIQMEKLCLYKISTDELYEVNREAFQALKKLDGTISLQRLKLDEKLLRFCIREKLLIKHRSPQYHPVTVRKAPIPSLRYLELIITRRCTRNCAHCYLGKPKSLDMKPSVAYIAMKQFEEIGGLRLLISGGEPLAHPNFERINELLAQYKFRKVLLTNGDLLTRESARQLNVHEVQVSIDGLEKGHDVIRGRGSFKKAIKAVENARAEGLDVSVATMIHSYNLDELVTFRRILLEIGVKEWNLDFPCLAGNAKKDTDLFPPLEKAGRLLSLGFGGSYHGASDGWACGRHLASVSPKGEVLRCGFYEDTPLGSLLKDGLLTTWKRKKHIRLSKTDCATCEYALECGGGCRFRAGTDTARDPFMCAVWGKRTPFSFGKKKRGTKGNRRAPSAQ